MRKPFGADYQRRVRARCWSPWDRFLNGMSKIQYLLVFITFVGGCFVGYQYWPHSEYGHHEMYWWVVGIAVTLWWAFSHIIWGAIRQNGEVIDVPGMFMSDAGKFVWHNYTDLDIIAGMLKKRWGLGDPD